jgi:hypothetical protein
MRRLRTGRLAFTNRTATPDASSEGRFGASLPAPRLRGLHRRSIFAVIARDFTDNDAMGPDLCAIVQDLVRTASPSVWSTDLSHVYAKYVPEYVPTIVRASGCRQLCVKLCCSRACAYVFRYLNSLRSTH